MTVTPPIPESLRLLMEEVGPKWRTNVPRHVRLMIDAYSEVLRSAPKRGVDVTAGIAYGLHPRQVIDIYQPRRTAHTLSPALLFVHGGAFVDGSPNRSDEIYANVLHCFARHGIVGANIGYRLAPEARYPEATYDIAAAVAWVQKNAQAYGIDRDRLFLMGHSAGGAHVGSYAYDKRMRPPSGTGLAGLIIVSGRVRADALPENPNAHKVEAYYGSDASRYDNFSPVSHVDSDSPPTLVAWSEFENPLIDVYCAELVYRLALAKRRSPPAVWLPKHNHTSSIAHLNTNETALEAAICSFISARADR
jgi:acetyl esterase